MSIQKIGVQYKDEKIWVLVNMALSGAGLTIGLLGFGIGSKISDFDPSFTIQGIDITYKGGGVLISGGLRGSIDPVNFVGELQVLAGKFGIAALAGYTSYEGSPSMFLYAVLNAPLGGPPAFFVTGIAGGFGFNRDLEIPDVSGVSTFPLVEWAQGLANPPGMNMTGDIGKQVDDVLERLANDGVVAPRVGQYWLAATASSSRHSSWPIRLRSWWSGSATNSKSISSAPRRCRSRRRRRWCLPSCNCWHRSGRTKASSASPAS